MLMLQSAVHFVVQSVVNRLICMCYVIESNATVVLLLDLVFNTSYIVPVVP